jgi:hypothetical protein
LAVAFVTPIELSPESDDSLQILVSPIDGAAPAKIVATQTSALPAWSADGRSLLCFKGEEQGGSSGDLRLGALKAFELLDAEGRILANPQDRDLAGLIFHDRNRLHCLRDGRVLFNAAEFNLPIASKDRKTREEFFVADPAGTAVSRLFPRALLAGLPPSLAHFEVSPDDTQILVSSEEGAVWLLTLADQRVEKVCEGAEKGDSIAAVWRAPGEFTYRKVGGPRAELVLRRGSTETILSRTWPDEVLQRLIE